MMEKEGFGLSKVITNDLLNLIIASNQGPNELLLISSSSYFITILHFYT